MTVTVSNLQQTDRSDWEVLYHGYAEFYRVPMNAEILDTVYDKTQWVTYQMTVE